MSLLHNHIVQVPQRPGLGAVHVEPPVADEVLLLEQGPIGAQETVLEERKSLITVLIWNKKIYVPGLVLLYRYLNTRGMTDILSLDPRSILHPGDLDT